MAANDDYLTFAAYFLWVYTDMKTIQSKTSGGYKYWHILKSRRINGKQRPIVLAYLGKADNLFRPLQGITQNIKLKSYSHGGVCAFIHFLIYNL